MYNCYIKIFVFFFLFIIRSPFRCMDEYMAGVTKEIEGNETKKQHNSLNILSPPLSIKLERPESGFPVVRSLTLFHPLLNLQHLHPDFHHRIRIQRNRIYPLLHQKLSKLREIAWSLAAETTVFIVSLCALHSH